MVQLPYGALKGFSLEAERRLIADYYGVPERTLRRLEGPARNDRVLGARDALCWRLTHERGLSSSKLAELLRCDAETISAGAAAHQARIDRFHHEASGGRSES